MIRVNQITKKVPALDKDVQGDLILLNNISFSIEKGESVAITGPSGSGKSTLLGLLAGLDKIDHGHVKVDGVEISELSEDQRAQLRADKIGFVFQSFHLLPNLTALENVMLPLDIQGRPDAKSLSQQILTQVGLDKRLVHYPKQLSGGEQQRVAIARAFVTKPKILFADEPTGNLDRATGERVVDLLFDLNRDHGTTLVLVTHDESLAAKCDRRLALTEGRLES